MQISPGNRYGTLNWRMHLDTADPQLDYLWSSPTSVNVDVIHQAPDQNFRPRWVLRRRNVNAARTGDVIRWQYSLNDAAFVFITDVSSVIKVVNSAQYENQDDSLFLLLTVGPSLFSEDNGCLVDEGDASTAAFDWPNQNSLAVELEINLQIVGADVSEGDKIELRLILSDGETLQFGAELGTGLATFFVSETAKPSAAGFLGPAGVAAGAISGLSSAKGFLGGHLKANSAIRGKDN